MCAGGGGGLGGVGAEGGGVKHSFLRTYQIDDPLFYSCTPTCV